MCNGNDRRENIKTCRKYIDLNCNQKGDQENNLIQKEDTGLKKN